MKEMLPEPSGDAVETALQTAVDEITAYMRQRAEGFGDARRAEMAEQLASLYRMLAYHGSTESPLSIEQEESWQRMKDMEDRR